MFPYEYQQTGEHPGASAPRREGPVCRVCLLPPCEYVCHDWLQRVLVKIPNSGEKEAHSYSTKTVAWCHLPRTLNFRRYSEIGSQDYSAPSPVWFFCKE